MNLEEFCQHFRDFLNGQPELPELLRTGRKVLSELMKDPAWFKDYLEKLITDRDFPGRREESVYPNEITLYRSPDKSFRVLGYIWEPSTSSYVHDHGSWGIIGALIHPVREKKFQRVDDRRLAGYAELKETSSQVIPPGACTCVLPLEEGIHHMEAALEQYAVTVSVYGRSLRRGAIQFFDPERKRVRKVYPPSLYKRVLALRALRGIPANWAQDLLAEILTSLPDSLREEPGG